MTVLLDWISTVRFRFLSKKVSRPASASKTLRIPAVRCSQVLALESSRSSITPGAPEFSILTTSSASSAGPVIWLRWSKHHCGSSICHGCIVATEGGRKLGCLPACASCSAVSRRATRARWRSVSAACNGERNSKKPAGKSRAALNPDGAAFTGMSRSESETGVTERPGLVLLVAICSSLRLQHAQQRTGAHSKARQLGGHCQTEGPSNLLTANQMLICPRGD